MTRPWGTPPSFCEWKTIKSPLHHRLKYQQQNTFTSIRPRLFDIKRPMSISAGVNRHSQHRWESIIFCTDRSTQESGGIDTHPLLLPVSSISSRYTVHWSGGSNYMDGPRHPLLQTTPSILTLKFLAIVLVIMAWIVLRMCITVAGLRSDLFSALHTVLTLHGSQKWLRSNLSI